jgi:ABC-type dipeptide/oligopeptide/nickel transport system ATPase component
MTGQPIARVKNVSHRYGATVSLADVSIDIPSRIMVGVIGPDGVGKSTLLGLIAGVKEIQHGEVVVFDKSIADQETLREIRGRIAGPRPQPLPDALRLREHRFLWPIVRIVGDRASLQDHRASHGDKPGEIRSASRRQAFRRHESVRFRKVIFGG